MSGGMARSYEAAAYKAWLIVNGLKDSRANWAAFKLAMAVDRLARSMAARGPSAAATGMGMGVK